MAYGSDRASGAKIAAETIRRGLNDLIIKKAPDVNVAESLRKQHNLFNIESNIITKSAQTADTARGRVVDTVLGVGKDRDKLLNIGKVALGTTALGAATALSTPIAIGLATYGTGKFIKKIASSPKISKYAGEALKLIGKKGNLDDLPAEVQQEIIKELKLLPAPTKQKLLPSPETIPAIVSEGAKKVQDEFFVTPSGVISNPGIANAEKVAKERVRLNELGLTQDVQKNINKLEGDKLKKVYTSKNPIIQKMVQNPNMKLFDVLNDPEFSEALFKDKPTDWTKIDALWKDSNISTKQKVSDLVAKVPKKDINKATGAIISILQKNKNKTALSLKLEEAFKKAREKNKPLKINIPK
jgi:hypothetical protein